MQDRVCSFFLVLHFFEVVLVRGSGGVVVVVVVGGGGGGCSIQTDYSPDRTLGNIVYFNFNFVSKSSEQFCPTVTCQHDSECAGVA